MQIIDFKFMPSCNDPEKNGFTENDDTKIKALF